MRWYAGRTIRGVSGMVVMVCREDHQRVSGMVVMVCREDHQRVSEMVCRKDHQRGEWDGSDGV